MPVKPESRLYSRVRENLEGCRISRIENRVNLGIPDCLIAMKPEGIFVPVELKVVRRGRKVELRPHQVAFHVSHADMGCPTFILVEYHPPGTVAARKAELLLYRGEQALALVKLGIDAEPLDRWNYAAPMWHRLRQHLAES